MATQVKSGDHVMMTYKGRDLLGEVVHVNHPRKPEAYDFLTVKHFNGEFWPLEPLCWEVRVLERTYSAPNEDS